MILPERFRRATGAARRKLWVLIGALTALHLSAALAATTPEEAQQLLLRGDYPATFQAADEVMKENPNDVEWLLIRAEALGKVGRYKQAREILDQAVER